MTITFPTSLDALTNPTTGDPLYTALHAAQHADANDAIEALEEKVGSTDSPVATSHDHKINRLLGVDSLNLSSAYTVVLADRGKRLTHPSTDVTPRILTIQKSSLSDWPDGASFAFDVHAGAGALTILVDTADGEVLEMVGAAGLTGARTLGSGGTATAWFNLATGKWRITGSAELS